MKNLKLFAFTMIIAGILISCSNTSEEATQASIPEQITAVNEENNEAVQQAVIQEEGIEIEEIKEIAEDNEPLSQAVETISTTADKLEAKPSASSKTEAAQPSKSTDNTTKKSVTETINKKIKQPELKKTLSSPKASTKQKISGKPSHSAFNTLLKRYVTSSGRVNYSGFKSRKSDLDDYLKHLEDNPVQSSWSKNEKMAYWINLYNAATIQLILENNPKSSIKEINDEKPWDKRWIKSGSKTYTLNEIENLILRPQFKDARVHFAINCAAVSCPRLMNKAFTADNLDSLLDENARWFINNSTYNSLSAKKVEISKIFDWYADDFGNVIDYLNRYATTEIKSAAKITYKEYNWNLNGK